MTEGPGDRAYADPDFHHREMESMRVGTMVAAGCLTLVLGAWTSSAHAITGFVANWPMNETSGNTMHDTAGGNDGTTYNVDMTGWGYVFDIAAHSKVVVPSSETLNPGSDDFSYGVTERTGRVPPVGTDYDVIRKGISSTSGGEYKLEIVNTNGTGRAFCLVKDSDGHSTSVKGTTDVADGTQHALSCTKTGTTLTLRVDSLKPRVKTPVTGIGSISNTRALVIGAKTPTVTGDAGDWYDGTLFEAHVSR